MKSLLGFRGWHGVLSVVLAAGVGATTNLVTGGFSWALAAAAGALVAVQVGLSMWQGRADVRDRRAARDAVLGALRPAVPRGWTGGSGVARGSVIWLTAPFSPTPLWGRAAVRDRLVGWCVDRDPGAGVVRVLEGPAGVGKSRLALAVAEALPAPWVAGRLETVDGLVERIVAAGDPTLVIVDDADRKAGLDVLIARAVRHPELVRLLLVTRDSRRLGALPDELLPQVAAVEALEPIGASGDRERWFAEATRCYARVLGVAPPELSARPVGRDEDTLLLLHTRALLAALGRAGVQDWTLPDLARALITLEQRSWTQDIAGLPAGSDTALLAEALTVLLLRPAETDTAAAAALWQVPRLAHDSAHESRYALARWARRRYPPGPDHRPDLRPHLVAERLLLDTLTRQPALLQAPPPEHVRDPSGDHALPVLARAYGSFPDQDALTLITALLTERPESIPAGLATLLATGIATPALDHALADLVGTVRLTNRAELAALGVPTTHPHLACAIGAVSVALLRDLAGTEPARYRPDLGINLTSLATAFSAVGRHHDALAAIEEAVTLRRELVATDSARFRSELAFSLTNLASNQRTIGRHHEALSTAEEAVTLQRELVATDPARYRPYLAGTLIVLAINLRAVERHRDALTVNEEVVALQRELVAAEPTRHRSDLAVSLSNMSTNLAEVGRHREALAAAAEAVTLHRELATEPTIHRRVFVTSLNNLAAVLWEMGRHREALVAIEEAVALQRELVVTEPALHRPELAMNLTILAASLRAVGRHREALVAIEETVALRRQLVSTEPALHRPDLAGSLTNMAVNLSEVERHPEALTAIEEAIMLQRELVAAEPARYRLDLAISLSNAAGSLWNVRRHREAVASLEEAVLSWRELARVEPARHLPYLATSLENLGSFLLESGSRENALAAFTESVAVWKAGQEYEPDLHGPEYRRAEGELRKLLSRLGQHEEAVAADLTGTPPATDSSDSTVDSEPADGHP